jgi:cytochrome d ubiquinol oxidase subunit I
LWRRGALFTHRPTLWLFVFAVLGPQLANPLGWTVAEVGRQPWVVYGLMKTADGISRVVSAQEILVSLVLFTSVYAMLFAVFIFLLDQKIRRGPAPEELGSGQHIA